MALALVLDLLILAIPLLVVPLGLWLGAKRQLHIGAGILLAQALIATLATSWGDFLASLFDSDVEKASFAAAVLFLFGGALIGSLVAVTIETEPPTPDGQLVGGMLAWVHAVLFLSVGLHAFDQLWSPGVRPAVLDEAILAEFLAVHVGWVLLAVAVIAVALSIASLVVRYQLRWQERSAAQLRDSFRPLSESAPGSAQQSSREERPVRIPRNADAGKVEPDRWRARAWGVRSGSERRSPSPREQALQETMANSLPLRPQGDQPQSQASRNARGTDRLHDTGGTWPKRYAKPTGQELSTWLRYAAGIADPSDRPEGQDVPPAPMPPGTNQSDAHPGHDAPPPDRQVRSS